MEDISDEGSPHSMLNTVDSGKMESNEVDAPLFKTVADDNEQMNILYGKSYSMLDGEEEELIGEPKLVIDGETEEEYMIQDADIDEHTDDVVDGELNEESTEEGADPSDSEDEVISKKNKKNVRESEEQGDGVEEEQMKDVANGEENGNTDLVNKENTIYEEENEEQGGGEEREQMEEEREATVEAANEGGAKAEMKNEKQVKENAKSKRRMQRKPEKRGKMTLKGKKKVIPSAEQNVNVEFTDEETMNKMSEKDVEDEEHPEEDFDNEDNSNDEDGKEEVKIEKQVKSVSLNKSGNPRKRGRKGKKMGAMNGVTPKGPSEQNPANKKKKKKDKIMGMIFMCSSKTKQDCYHFKVLGLPANKRDTVLQIDEGMKLFLFDFDLKLLYGVYKAAGPGGYNIEPKAFNSCFPSQVRFNVYEDCLPLPEEEFRKVIKENYYTRTKFDCQLTSEQVKNLCKLFQAVNKGSKSKKLHRGPRPETRPLDRGRTRKQRAKALSSNEDRNGKQRAKALSSNEDRNGNQHAKALSSNQDRIRKQHAKALSSNEDRIRKRRAIAEPSDEYRSKKQRARAEPSNEDRIRKQHPMRERKPAFRREKLHRDKEAHARRPLHLPLLPRQLAPPCQTYAYEGLSSGRSDPLKHWDRQIPNYGRRESFLDYYDGRVPDSNLRLQEEVSYRDPYHVYRDRPLYPDRLYSTSQSSTYRQPAVQVRHNLYDRYNGTSHARSWY